MGLLSDGPRRCIEQEITRLKISFNAVRLFQI